MNIESIKSSSIFNTVKSIPNGQMVRVNYCSDMPLKAEFKKLGWKITKHSDVTVRLGVDYEHISNIIEAKANGEIHDSTATSNYEWVIANKICYNRKTDKYYLRVTSIHNNNSKHICYDITDENGNVVNVETLNDTNKNMVQNSYWNRSGAPEVQNIKLENIISVNGVFA